MLNIYLVRHGETLANVENKIQGQSELSLTERGKIEIKNLAIKLKDKGLEFDLVYSSDQKRAIETKDIIMSTLDYNHTNFKIDRRLREWEFGSFDGQYIHKVIDDLRSSDDQNKLNNDSVVLSLKNVSNYIYNNDISGKAEKWEYLKDRIWSSFSSIITDRTTQNILIVSHGLTILTLLNIIDVNKSKLRTLPNGSISVIRCNNMRFEIDDLQCEL